MGVKLDWQIDAERIAKREGEDPDSRKYRRSRRSVIILLIFLVTAGVLGSIALVWFRLTTVDNQIHDLLINAAQNETAALRTGDYANFIALQRSSGDDWMKYQIDRFHRYQDLIKANRLVIVGNVLDVAIDGTRGRTVLEETLDGVPYRTIWYYWRFPDGWHHVPSDYTFWGDPQKLDGKVSTINYTELDAKLAQGLASRIDQWWASGCIYLQCKTPPKLTVQIVADPTTRVRWDDADSTKLLVSSPLATEERSRLDVELPATLEDEIASQLATRQFDLATSNLQPVQTSDASWLRRTAIDWLATTFTGRGLTVQLTFMQSLKDKYGQAAIGSVVQKLSAVSDISIVGQALGQPLEALAVDWRAFFQWRLDAEKLLITDAGKFQILWDTATPAALNLMRQRMQKPSQATPQVQSVTIGTSPNGVPTATIQTTSDGKPFTVIFRLVGGTWKRSA